MTDSLTRRVALISTVLGGLTAVGLGLVFGTASALSCLVGTVLGVANFWALVRLVQTLLDPERSDGRRARAVVLLGAKTLALVVVIGVVVVNHWVRGGALMAGLTAVALSIVLGGALQRGDDNSPPGRSLS